MPADPAPSPAANTAKNGQTTPVGGPLAFVGGYEWTPGAEEVDRALLALAATDEVAVLPTACAFERPDLAVATATEWFASLGAKVRSIMLLTRQDAEDPKFVEAIGAARFIYLSGGSPLHLKQVLKDSPAWEALVQANQSGAILAGSSAGAMVLGDPMVDPRGGTLTVGLGVVHDLAIVPHADTWSPEKLRRTLSRARPPVLVAAVDERTSLVRGHDETWSKNGPGRVRIYDDGNEVGLNALSGR